GGRGVSGTMQPARGWAAATVSAVLMEAGTLQRRVRALGAAITAAYAGHPQSLVLVGVLTGGAYFLADLTQAIDLPVAVDYLAISRYEAPGAGAGQVRLLQDLDLPIGGCDVLLVEDVIDTGLPQ